MSTLNQQTGEQTPCSPARTGTWREPVMFIVALAHLLATAVLVQSANGRSLPDYLRNGLHLTIAILWLVCLVEVASGVVRRDRAKPRRPVLLRAILACLFPPTRMAQPDPVTGLVWLPVAGWNLPSDELHKRVTRVFAVPLCLCVVVLLPLFLVDLVGGGRAAMPEPTLALAIAVATFWVVVTSDLVISCRVHPKSPLAVLTARVADVTLVLLPVVALVLANWSGAVQLVVWLRILPAVSPERLDTKQQSSQIQALLTRVWAVLVLLALFLRPGGRTPERRLEKVLAQIAERKERIANEVKELVELRKRETACRTEIAEHTATRN